MLGAGFVDSKNVIARLRLYSHYRAAEALLPLLDANGSYPAINGQTAFGASPQPGTGSIAVEIGGEPRGNKVVMWAYPGLPLGTCPGSPPQSG